MKVWSALLGLALLAALACGCGGEKDRGKYQDMDKPRAPRDESPGVDRKDKDEAGKKAKDVEKVKDKP
jgi:hypothetical protein